MAFFLEDDDQSVVEAALSFVDEFAVSTPASAALVGASSGAEPAQRDEMTRREQLNERKKMLRTAGVYGNSNHVRNNRRIEIAYLREQLEKLQLDVEVLKKQKGGEAVSRATSTRRTPPSKRQSTAHPPTAETIVAMNAPTMSTVWENIADSQRRRRKKAECENIRLKLVLEHQKKVAESLRALIQKRASQLGSECSFFTEPGFANHHALDLRGDLGEFQSLFRHLDNAYQELDAVFAANGLNRMVVTRSDIQVRDGVGGNLVELLFNKVLPFKLQDATEATWNHFRGSEKHYGNGSIYEKTVKDTAVPFTIVEDFTKEMHSNSFRADAKMKQAIRRYVEPDRDVVIAVVSVNPAEVKHEKLGGLKYQVRSYAVTKRSAASTPEQEVSQLQCCSLISFDEETETRLGADAIQALTNFLIVSLAAKMQGHQDCIENALMDHVLPVAS